METDSIDICVYAYYGRNNKPYFCGIYNCDNGKSQVIPLYMPSQDFKVYDAEQNKNKIKKLLIRCMADRTKIITSDFKLLLEAFDIPFYAEQLNVYDLLLPELQTPESVDQTKDKLSKLLPAMASIKLELWHKMTANAAMAYSAIENRGLTVFDRHVCPRWSQRTYSGRTKTSVYNIQGASEGEQIHNPAGRYDDYFIHFDWRAADIRMAALLSNDEALSLACENLDPYQHVADLLSDGNENGLTRDECKLALLTSINAMDCDAHIFDAFPGLRKWISDSKKKLANNEPLFSILGRKYTKDKGRKNLSVFNATMQGSIAHAMQLTAHRVWSNFGLDWVAEIHDSIVVTCPRSNATVKSVVDRVSKIMAYPFSGVLDSNPVFPVKVSIGNSWKTWVGLKVYP